MADKELLSILLQMVGTVLFTLAYYAFCVMVLVSLACGVATGLGKLGSIVKGVTYGRMAKKLRRPGRHSTRTKRLDRPVVVVR